jgi:hypothetical protein
MSALLGIGCGKFLQSIFLGGLRHGFPDGFVLGRYAGLCGPWTPGPLPLKGLTGAGFCKNGLPNLERLGDRGQILDNKRLTVFFATFVCTAPP